MPLRVRQLQELVDPHQLDSAGPGESEALAMITASDDTMI